MNLNTDHAGRGVDALNGIFDGMLTNLQHQWKREAMILNESQVEAIYSAMCALNNISGIVHVVMPGQTAGDTITVFQEVMSHEVVVILRSMIEAEPVKTERYKDQGEFAQAYGLD
jgi:uncharacterized protein YjaG (DUF416 family)